MKINIIVFLLCLFAVACQSGTLIVGNLPQQETTDVNHADLVGQTVYLYPESEIKPFLESKKAAVSEAVSQQTALQRKCEELRSKIPEFDSMDATNQYEKAIKSAAECTEEYEANKIAASRIYFENLPPAKFTAKIDEYGKYVVKVPSGVKYALIVPNHCFVWVNAAGSEKFLTLNAVIDPNADVIY